MTRRAQLPMRKRRLLPNDELVQTEGGVGNSANDQLKTPW